MKIKAIKKITLKDSETLSRETNALRQLRVPILKAFDIYKSNVYYGIITETEAEHLEIMAWYQDLCDLKLNSLKEIPTNIKKYL